VRGQAVAVHETEKRHRLAPQTMDDVTMIDDLNLFEPKD